jgi:diacylglycerol kinase
MSYYLSLEIRRINLAFRSICTNFAVENEVDRFEQLATTVKNAKTQPSVAVCILSTIPVLSF